MAQDTRQTPSVRTQPVPTFQPRRPIADITLNFWLKQNFEDKCNPHIGPP